MGIDPELRNQILASIHKNAANWAVRGHEFGRKWASEVLSDQDEPNDLLGKLTRVGRSGHHNWSIQRTWNELIEPIVQSQRERYGVFGFVSEEADKPADYPMEPAAFSHWVSEFVEGAWAFFEPPVEEWLRIGQQAGQEQLAGNPPIDFITAAADDQDDIWLTVMRGQIMAESLNDDGTKASPSVAQATAAAMEYREAIAGVWLEFLKSYECSEWFSPWNSGRVKRE